MSLRVTYGTRDRLGDLADHDGLKLDKEINRLGRAQRQAHVDGETRASQRHELIGGRLFAMAGGTERHDLAPGLVYEALAPGARRAGGRTSSPSAS